MPTELGGNGGIKATETAFDIIETIHDEQPVRLTELAESVGIANSTAHDHLSTLQEHGYVVERDDGYYLALTFLDHGMRAKDYYQELLEVSKPALQQLVTETDEAVNLVVEEHDRAVYIERLTGERGVPTNSWVGKQKLLHSLSAGKAILAHLPDERVNEILDSCGLPAATEQTITSREQLLDELETIRERGVAFNDRESHAQIRAIGAPIVVEGRTYGAVSVAGPAKRLTGEYFREEISDLLLGAVNEIELKLTYM
ncbi:IclR family transcriptional regulator [Natronolimnohabitans sp. A-GB9]|uniref:IclR family transcriptional regulator n=1 Tax=Natronolimnohabitans sp. A-GB9 TaxID=3069757 RepID=UPI0027B1FE02|nr:IclR family transcriptional regulator [Natronolimnohabitans sp. A-GB9]MDQ2052168.1 IclR family transcriptional regulator [Natronolimnohabitans sp. A-GB9]